MTQLKKTPLVKNGLKLRQLFTLKSKQWLLAWFIGLLTVIATVGLLAFSGWFISASAIAGIVMVGGAISFDFLRPGAIIRGLAMIRTAGRYGERLASHHAVLGLLTELRVVFFNSLSGQKISFVTNVVQSSDTMQRLTHDISQLDELPLRFWAVWLWSILLQLVLVMIMTVLSPELVMPIIAPLLLAGVFLPMVAVFFGKKIALQHTESAESRRRNLLNPLTASTHLILWQRWQDFQQVFYDQDEKYTQIQLRQRYVGMFLNTIQQLLLAVVIILLLIFGFDLIANHSLSVPLLLAYVLAVFGLYEILLPLASSYTSYGFALASQQRLNALIEQTPTRLQDGQDKNSTLSIEPVTLEVLDSLSISNLSAKFPQALAGVSNVNYQLKAGDLLFITGRSGAGKSTFLHALAGELTDYTGQVLINGIELRNTDIAEQLGFLAQQLDIFDLTLAENLRVGNVQATDKELWQSLATVELADWAKQQPQLLNTQLGEYGVGISGGQARRVALARLLLKPRCILLLDEPFAGLDAKTADKVFNSLKNQQQNGLLIIVSHQYVSNEAKILNI